MADPLTIGMMAASTAMTALGSVSAGNAAAANNNAMATQAENAARLSRASAQRAAAENLRKSRIMQGNAIADAASSGGNASDVGVANIVGDIAAEGQYRAMSSIFEGDVQANNYTTQASALRTEGSAARKSGYMKAVGSVFDGGSSLYSKYWPKSSGGPLNNVMDAGWKSQPYGSNITWNMG